MKRLLVLTVLALAGGCGSASDSTAPGDGAPNVVGSYTLQTVAGIAVPGVLLANYQGTKIEVLDDAYTLNADHTWSEHGTLRSTDLTSGAVTTAPESGKEKRTHCLRAQPMAVAAIMVRHSRNEGGDQPDYDRASWMSAYAPSATRNPKCQAMARVPVRSRTAEAAQVCRKHHAASAGRETPMRRAQLRRPD
jgi:hypothetical protein